jgi:hypothetical protein
LGPNPVVANGEFHTQGEMEFPAVRQNIVLNWQRKGEKDFGDMVISPFWKPSSCPVKVTINR